MVRTDSREQKLDAFFKPPNQIEGTSSKENRTTSNLASSSTLLEENSVEKIDMDSRMETEKRFDF